MDRRVGQFNNVLSKIDVMGGSEEASSNRAKIWYNGVGRRSMGNARTSVGRE